MIKINWTKFSFTLSTNILSISFVTFSYHLMASKHLTPRKHLAKKNVYLYIYHVYVSLYPPHSLAVTSVVAIKC